MRKEGEPFWEPKKRGAVISRKRTQAGSLVYARFLADAVEAYLGCASQSSRAGLVETSLALDNLHEALEVFRQKKVMIP